MSYTRLSSNFQPKTASWSRREALVRMIGLSTLAFWPNFADGATETEIQPAPPMTSTILTADGYPLFIKQFKGRPLLINFWATWCPPCVAELPSLDRAVTKLASEVAVLLISVDRGGSNKALPFLQKRGIGSPNLAFDPTATLSREMGVRGLPTSFLISADQQYSWIYIGPREWSDAKMITELKHLAQKTNLIKKSTNREQSN
ncbi:TlpA family protein disulfide reductase [Candidatus Puniceispirillum sp.]|nr:TlpA family protein disulfide reductase [Candidatus Puniceispirillum sp.]